MKTSYVKLWIIVSVILAVTAVIIRSIWQIVVIPTGGTMLIFIPLILGLLLLVALFSYLVIKPEKMKSLAFAIGMTTVLTLSLIAGVTHFFRFIFSPEAEHVLCKVIGNLVVISSVSGYFFVIYLIWTLRKARQNGQPKI